MKTMDDKYGDGTDCVVCEDCGMCITCGDCRDHGCGNEVVRDTLLSDLERILEEK
ncbi:MAG: hypothetical protein UU59_C0051G0003 [candidate division WWE3 bacterium GW2011_GWE1_41_27]|uniref:Uncharacterized protein n=1 Tax=candidate division WWE3 bacterium GW2011_GWE1_41_27 TaxID=1619131 RepID=A0A0G0YXT6_UNCKA|nr:MAG: hypothetical protein UU59_C0051G0003 [candidate division WWE3 bacterium GW2011_GWE1_41_27]